jgi:hypothetical protein
MEILPGALAAAVALDRAGHLIFVVINQRVWRPEKFWKRT